MAEKLELVVETKAAKQAIAELSSELARLKKAITSTNVNKNLAERLNELGNVKPISALTVRNLTQLSAAVGALSKAGSIAAAVNSLAKLSKVDVGNAAKNMAALVQELNRIRIPPSLAKLAPVLNQIAKDARTTSKSIRTITTAAESIRAPAGINKLRSSITTTGKAARDAAGSINIFGKSARLVTGLLAGFGVALGSVGFANFVSQSKEAVFTMDRFRVLMTALEPAGANAASGLSFVNKLADSTATSMSVLTDSYGKFSASALNTGFTVRETNSVFENMTGVFRTLNLSAGDARLAMLALEQMVSKNKISSEELRRQLGERIPGAVKIFADSVGVSTQELEKLLRAGAFDGRTVIKFAEEMASKFKLSGEALKTPQAQLQLLGNAVFRLQEQFGRGLFESLLPGVQAFTQAVSSGDLKEAFNDMGKTIGTFASDTLQALADNGPAIADFFKTVVSGIKTAATFISENAGLIKTALLALVGIQVASWAVTVVGGLISFGSALVTVTVAAVAFLGPIGAAVAIFAAVAAGAAGLTKLFSSMTGEQEKNTAAVKGNITANKQLDDVIKGRVQSSKQAAQEIKNEVDSAKEYLRTLAGQIQANERRITQAALLKKALKEEADGLNLASKYDSDRYTQIQKKIKAQDQVIAQGNRSIALVEFQMAQTGAQIIESEKLNGALKTQADAMQNGTDKTAAHAEAMRKLRDSSTQLADGTGMTQAEMLKTGQVYDVTANLAGNLAKSQSELGTSAKNSAQGLAQAGATVKQFSVDVSTASQQVVSADQATSTSLNNIAQNTREVSTEAKELSSSFTTVKTTTEGLGTNIGTIAEATDRLGTNTNRTNEAIQSQVTALQSVSPEITKVASGMDAAVSSVNSFSESIASTTGPMTTLVGSVQTLAATLGQVVPQVTTITSNMVDWNKAAEGIYSTTLKLITALQQLTSSATTATHSVNQLSQSFHNSASASDSAARGYDRAREALERLNDEKARDSGGRSSTNVSAQRKGGYAGERTQSQTVPSTAFDNAPRFSQGTANTSAFTSTVPGGGIPSILHPNEAVIPLSGGRSVPVTLSGGGGGMIDPYSQEQLTTLVLIRDEIGYFRENAKQHVTLLIDRLRNIELGIENTVSAITMVSSDIKNMSKNLADAISKISTASASSSYSGSSGSSSSRSSSGGGSSGYSGNIEWTYHTKRNANRSLTVSKQVDSTWLAQFDRETQIAILNEANRKTNSGGLGGAGDFNSGQRDGLGFATGSPNAFKDATGGFQATLHPDEAVIPLPDGRSVPVDLGESNISGMFDKFSSSLKNISAEKQNIPVETSSINMKELKEAMASSMPRSSLDGKETQDNNIEVNVTMNVYAKDADSFRKTESQITQELTDKLSKVSERVGTRRSYDDPTKRIK